MLGLTSDLAGLQLCVKRHQRWAGWGCTRPSQLPTVQANPFCFAGVPALLGTCPMFRLTPSSHLPALKADLVAANVHVGVWEQAAHFSQQAPQESIRLVACRVQGPQLLSGLALRPALRQQLGVPSPPAEGVAWAEQGSTVAGSERQQQGCCYFTSLQMLGQAGAKHGQPASYAWDSTAVCP